MKLSKLPLLVIICLVMAVLAAFTDPPYKNHKSSYMLPIRPGQDNFLAGTMGELRSSHFHAGIDIKTGGIEGLPVYSAEDGYISRIKVSAWGYGNALYIIHPNGQTTVYAHLKRFNDKVAEYVRNAQYEKQSFEIELFPEKQFAVKKGDTIAFSGNTGGSGGPHLHFEIRDGQQRPLNPLKYGFPEIKDNIPPIIEKVAIQTLDKEARINNRQGRFEFKVQRNGSEYTLKETIYAKGTLGLELLTYDKLNGAPNKNGVSCIQLNLDDQQVFYQNIDKFPFGKSRNILVHQNYAVLKQTGKKYNKLYVDDGNELDFYETNPGKGKVIINDTAFHNVNIKLWDNYENTSSLSFQLKGEKPLAAVKTDDAATALNNGFHIDDNTLKIFAEIDEGEVNYAEVYANRMKFNLTPAYIINNSAVYLWDLTLGLPDSSNVCGISQQYTFKAIVHPNNEFSFYDQAMNIYFPRKSLFDTLYLQTKYQQSPNYQGELFSINEDLVPLRKNIYITLKPKLRYPLQEKTDVYALDEFGGFSYKGGEWKDGGIKFNTRNFGTYTLLTDTIPPTIKPVAINEDNVSFIIKDELSGIDQYRLKVNDQWVLMNYDYKRNLIWSEKLNEKILFSGEIVLRVTDNAGNENIFTTKIE